MANVDFKEKDGVVDIQGNVTLNGSEIQPKLTAGDGISIDDGVISASNIKVLLWTNPNPTVPFAAQTITLSSSDYDYLMFILKDHKTVNRCYSVIVKKGQGANFLTFTNFTYNPYNYNQIRTADYVSDTSYSISENKRCSTDNSDIGTSNDRNYPIEIIGIKVV